MLRLLAAAAAALILAACGDDGGAAAPAPATPLNPAFSGTWTGTTTVSSPGVAPFSYSSSVVIAVSGQTATVSAICPDGSGSISAQGSGDSAAWQGSFTCPPIALDTCPAVTLTYQNASMTLNANGTLTASGSGIASGCAITLPVTLTFNGAK
jgi:hypothetical protein